MFYFICTPQRIGSYSGNQFHHTVTQLIVTITITFSNGMFERSSVVAGRLVQGGELTLQPTEMEQPGPKKKSSQTLRGSARQYVLGKLSINTFSSSCIVKGQYWRTQNNICYGPK